MSEETKKAGNKFFKEFKEFAIKGNMIDMAVGIIIGTAFNNVVNTLVKKVIMPPLSAMTDGVHISDRKYIIKEATETTEEIAVEYGELIEVLVDFLIIAFTVFILIKFLNALRETAYQAKLKSETERIKDAIEELVAPDLEEEKEEEKEGELVEEDLMEEAVAEDLDSESENEPEKEVDLDDEIPVERQKGSLVLANEQVEILEKIEKLLEKQNELLEKRK